MGLVMVHFRCVSQQNNHDPEVKQSLKEEKIICGLVNDPIFTTGPARCMESRNHSLLPVCSLSSTVSATFQGLSAGYWVTNEEIDVQLMERSSYNSCKLLSQEEKSPQLIHDKHMYPNQPGDEWLESHEVAGRLFKSS